jgi:hypothetical protein
MGVIGLSLWIGSFQERTRPWHLIGALARGVPITMNIIFYNLITSSSIGGAAVFGLTFHCVFSVVEVVAGLNLVGRRPHIRIAQR